MKGTIKETVINLSAARAAATKGILPATLGLSRTLSRSVAVSHNHRKVLQIVCKKITQGSSVKTCRSRNDSPKTRAGGGREEQGPSRVIL